MAEDDSAEQEDEQTQYGGDPEGESAVEQTQRRMNDEDEDDEGIEGDQGQDPDEDEGEYRQDETDPE